MNFFSPQVIARDEFWCYCYDHETKQIKPMKDCKFTPIKARQGISNVKTTLICFFNARGLFHSEFVSRDQTEPESFEKIAGQFAAWERRDLLQSVECFFHHNNHTTFSVCQFLTPNGMTLCPVTRFCSFFHFPEWKKNLLLKLLFRRIRHCKNEERTKQLSLKNFHKQNKILRNDTWLSDSEVGALYTPDGRTRNYKNFTHISLVSFGYSLLRLKLFSWGLQHTINHSSEAFWHICKRVRFRKGSASPIQFCHFLRHASKSGVDILTPLHGV